jgi:hypothetical protein
MVKPIKETKSDFYYKFPSNKWFVVRRLSGQWVHFYPRKDGQLPTAFSSKSSAIKYIMKWDSTAVIKRGIYTSPYHDQKVVSGTQASKYPVPKRY